MMTESRAKITDAEVLQIRMMPEDMSKSRIGQMFGVSRGHISRIINGKTRVGPGKKPRTQNKERLAR